ncbi:hypothetical protein DdX_02014 [Ditylenchus destructor]|uniref:Uncharacterized protein n=1 Tax=Ditylenchus destructor TaxID=166010 RepID=A0AAD4RBZ0_9BILA|nr:hypothetical protein DdX_02014 [Ditylenchus destructor]
MGIQLQIHSDQLNVVAMNLLSFAKSSSVQFLTVITIFVIFCSAIQGKPLEEDPSITAKQEKRFYSWEEGKRSAPFADPQHRLFYEDPWRRTLSAWANAKKSRMYAIAPEPKPSLYSRTETQLPNFIF